MLLVAMRMRNSLNLGYVLHPYWSYCVCHIALWMFQILIFFITMTQKQEPKRQDNAYSSFASIDATTSKPIYGSDGAASWQQFQSTSSYTSSNIAPSLPSKHTDRILGRLNRSQEVAYENTLRRESGEALVGSGYQTFKRKRNAEEDLQRKREKFILMRKRPEKTKYYLRVESGTFEGWKKDYVFTTRESGTGYYWDGMDSFRELTAKQAGEDIEKDKNDKGVSEASSSTAIETQPDKEVVSSQTTQDAVAAAVSKPKKKKKKKKKASVHDGPINPHDIPDQVPDNLTAQSIQTALQRKAEYIAKHSQQPLIHTTDPSQATHVGMSQEKGRTCALAEQAILMGQVSIANASHHASTSSNSNTTNDSSSLPHGWERAKDPTTHQTYYFHRGTGERSWNCPSSQTSLPEGWKETMTQDGNVYYFHPDGRTTWTRPTK